MHSLDLPNARLVTDGVISAGQPSVAQLRAVALAGVKTIVNLCALNECGWNEAEVVENLGMCYVAIPVPDASGVTAENARRLHEVLDDAGNRPVIVHCGSGNRVGALFALRAFHAQGRDAESAIEQGRLAGLTRLEPFVREQLSKAR